MPSITVSANGTEKRVPLEAPVVTVGRDYKAAVRLKDAKVSRRHCEIVKVAEGCYKVVDGGSSNGTFLNGVQVKERVLNPGDRITIGLTTLTFESGDAPAPRPTARGADAPSPVRTAEKKTMAAVSSSREKASARFLREATRKTANPLAAVIGICAVVLAGVTVWELTRPRGPDIDWVNRELDRLAAEGAVLEGEWKYDAAIAKHKEAFPLTAGHEAFRVREAEFRGKIRRAEQERALYDAAMGRYRAFDVEVRKPAEQRKPLQELLDVAYKLRDDYGQSKLPFLRELSDHIRELEALRPASPVDSYFVLRARLLQECKLESLDRGQFGQAIALWRKFLQTASAEGREKAGEEIARLNKLARDAAHRAKRKAEELAVAQSKGYAAVHLEQAIERLAGTDAEADLAAELRKYQ